MNNVVLTKSKVRELEQFGRYLENAVINSEYTKMFPALVALDEVYKEMIERIKS